MCKWNPDTREPESSRWCTHGHTEHEELHNPQVPSRAPYIWCEACWKVCAFQSSKEVRKGLMAKVSDAFNGTTRAPPYITLFNEAPDDYEHQPSNPAQTSSAVPITTSELSPAMQPPAVIPVQVIQRDQMPAALSTFNGKTRAPPYGTVFNEPLGDSNQAQSNAAVPITTSQLRPAVQFPAVTPIQGMQSNQLPPALPSCNVADLEVSGVDRTYGPMQNHNLARYFEFEEGSDLK